MFYIFVVICQLSADHLKALVIVFGKKAPSNGANYQLILMYIIYLCNLILMYITYLCKIKTILNHYWWKGNLYIQLA